LLGQAVVAYEIFTGTTLPRRELRRQWHMVLMLASGYSLAVGASFALGANPIYTILLASVFVAITYALLGWRAHAERQWHVAQLRPFVGGERVLDTLLNPNAAHARDTTSFFTPLCRDLLGARCAYLFPTGALASLIGAPLAYPARASIAFGLDEILPQCTGPGIMVLPVSPERYGAARWAVPLWCGRGLAGVFFLGDKSDGGLYSQEEIEVARASGERLLDTIALVNLAHRLMELQRQRFIETQVLDQQSRRALHDDILPSLHAAMLSLGGASTEAAKTPQALSQLGEVHRRLSALLREMPIGRASRVEDLGLVGALRDMVETEFARDFDDVTWEISSEAQRRARALPTLTVEIIFYAAKEVIRNAARHGRGAEPTRALRLHVNGVWRDGLQVRISDDGVGLARSADSQSTGGQGLALHSTMLAVLGGFLVTESRAGSGTTVTLSLPDEVWTEA
jgi:signal transduction histidine kinase